MGLRAEGRCAVSIIPMARDHTIKYVCTQDERAAAAWHARQPGWRQQQRAGHDWLRARSPGPTGAAGGGGGGGGSCCMAHDAVLARQGRQVLSCMHACRPMALHCTALQGSSCLRCTSGPEGVTGHSKGLQYTPTWCLGTMPDCMVVVVAHGSCSCRARPGPAGRVVWLGLTACRLPPAG